MKLKLLKGLPGSGKSTLAEKYVKDGWVRVNKDLIREMLHFGKFSNMNEKLVNDVERAIAIEALANGKSVVVDDTNLGERHAQSWKDLAEKAGAAFEIEELKTDFVDCIVRDIERGLAGGRTVGSHVIIRMAMQYGYYKAPKGYVLCDLDGTIANIDHRLQYGKGETKDWEKFFSLIPNDTPREEVIAQLYEYADQGYTIILVSARPERYRGLTVAWLAKYLQLPYFNLIMRGDHDKRPDTMVKADMLKLWTPAELKKIHMIIDDRPSVIRMWRELGFTVTDVGHGVEF